MEAVQKTPEREAFYKKIDGENLSALWNVMNDLITPEPRSACRPHLWKFDSIRDYMAAWSVEDHDVAVCGCPDGGPRRCRAGTPPQPVGAALRARRQGCGHRG
jgi:hypothetical protein